MKLKAMIYAIFFMSITSFARKMECTDKALADIDILQFRAPYCLGELLHNGLVSVEQKIQDLNLEFVAPTLDASAGILEQLHEQYIMMIDKSNMHTMNRDDRDFLQGMIDRIDQMIQSLETKRPFLEEEQTIVYKNLALLSDLKEKLAS